MGSSLSTLTNSSLSMRIFSPNAAANRCNEGRPELDVEVLSEVVVSASHGTSQSGGKILVCLKQLWIAMRVTQSYADFTNRIASLSSTFGMRFLSIASTKC